MYSPLSLLIYVNTLKLVVSKILKAERDLLYCHNIEEQKAIVIFSRNGKIVNLALVYFLVVYLRILSVAQIVSAIS
jgi:hypothetical protein